jgi:3-hydroxyacyl-CoA dehydrogenase
VTRTFETISLAKVSRSAAEAKTLGYLRASDGIVMNRERLLAAAKARALELAAAYQPPAPPEFRLPGVAGRTAIKLALENFLLAGRAMPHDRMVGMALAEVVTGGETADPTVVTDEEAMRKLARGAFMALVRSGPTLARMEHMLETGKPLRN